MLLLRRVSIAAIIALLLCATVCYVQALNHNLKVEMQLRRVKRGAAIAALQSLLLHADAGQHAYLSTGRTALLAPYKTAKEKISTALCTLGEQLQTEQEQAVFDQLRIQVLHRFSLGEQIIRHRRLRNVSVAWHLASTEGTNTKRDIQELLSHLATAPELNTKEPFEASTWLVGVAPRAALVLGILVTACILADFMAPLVSAALLSRSQIDGKIRATGDQPHTDRMSHPARQHLHGSSTMPGRIAGIELPILGKNTGVTAFSVPVGSIQQTGCLADRLPHYGDCL